MRNPFNRKKAKSPDAKITSAGQGLAIAVPAPRALGQARRFLDVIRMPHITEKSNASLQNGWYTFVIGPGATKGAVKAALRERFGVHVTAVRMIRARSRQVRLGRIMGKTPGVRKAMAKLKEGETINLT